MNDNTENPIIQRLKEYILTTGLSSTQFADKAGIPRPSFSQILSGRNKTISNQLLSKLHECFPDLDILWLLFGQPAAQVEANFESSGPQNTQSGSTEKTYQPENQRIYESDAPINSEPTASEQIENQAPNQAAEPQWTASVLCTPLAEAASNAPKTSDPVVDRPSTHGRTVSSILIIYSDGTFETFSPARD